MCHVDPFGALQSSWTGDIGVVLSQQRPPGDLDGLRGGVGRQLKPSVEVIARQGRARRHRSILKVPAGEEVISFDGTSGAVAVPEDLNHS